MVVSVNPEPHKSEFNALLNATIEELNAHAKKSPKKIEKTTESKKIQDWIEIVSTNSKSVRGTIHLDIKQMLTELIL